MKRFIPLFIGTFSILLIVAFSNYPVSKKPKSSKREVENIVDLDTKLYCLFLINDMTHDDLKRLFNQKKYRTKRIVFQFLYDSTGTLTLGAYGGKRRNRGYNDSFSPIFGRLYSAGWSNCTLPIANSNTNIYLGDQEISKKNGLKELEDVIYDPVSNKNADKFIVFKPVLNKSVIPNKFYVSYDIFSTNDTSTCIPKNGAFTGTVSTHTNPSPPYGGN